MYGTLKPGHERYSAIEPYVVGGQRALTHGTLYDINGSYPGAVFGDNEDGFVHGYCLTIREGTEAEVLDILDAIEGEGYLFRRVTVDAWDWVNGSCPSRKCRLHVFYECVSYEWMHDISQLTRIGSWKPERDYDLWTN